MEGVLVIFLFAGVVAITALLFGVWVFVGVLRLIFRGISALFVAPSRPSIAQQVRAHANETVQCASPACRATNPSKARFCRRCGHALPLIQHVAAARRAACW